SAPHLARAGQRLSEACAEWFESEQRYLAEGLIAKRSLNSLRLALWSFIEFVGCDAPRRELPAGTPAEYRAWLSKTKAAPRKPRSLPLSFSAAAVRSFLGEPPPRREEGRGRSGQTLGGYWARLTPF